MAAAIVKRDKRPDFGARSTQNAPRNRRFLGAFQGPSALYRLLGARHKQSPCFLHRTLSYLDRGRTGRHQDDPSTASAADPAGFCGAPIAADAGSVLDNLYDRAAASEQFQQQQRDVLTSVTVDRLACAKDSIGGLKLGSCEIELLWTCTSGQRYQAPETLTGFLKGAGSDTKATFEIPSRLALDARFATGFQLRVTFEPERWTSMVVSFSDLSGGAATDHDLQILLYPRSSDDEVAVATVGCKLVFAPPQKAGPDRRSAGIFGKETFISRPKPKRKRHHRAIVRPRQTFLSTPQSCLFGFRNETCTWQPPQQVELTCPWCGLASRNDVHGLLMHLRNCHPRFAITYQANTNLVGHVTISVAEERADPGNAADASPSDESPPYKSFCWMKEPTPPQNSEQPGAPTNFQDRGVHRAIDIQRRRPATRQYYRIGGGAMLPGDNSDDSEDDPSMGCMHKRHNETINEYLDVNEAEKKLMKLWNGYLLDNTVLADSHVEFLCRAFVRDHTEELQGLRNNLMLHFTTMFEFGVLDGTQIRSLAELVNKHVPMRL